VSAAPISSTMLAAKPVGRVEGRRRSRYPAGPRLDPATRRANRRVAVVLGLVALAFYVLIFLQAMR